MSEDSASNDDKDSKSLKGDVMNVEGVAEYLGLAPSTIYDKVRDLEMPHSRIGVSDVPLPIRHPFRPPTL